MDIEKDLQKRIDNLEKQLDSLYSSPTIPLDVDRSFASRGFSKVQTVAGRVTLNSIGTAQFTVTGATQTSIALGSYADPDDGAVGIGIIRGYATNNYGSSTTQFDITNPSGTTFRYTYDGTGSDPNINATTLPVGSRLQIFSSNFNSANQNSAARPYFYVTASGANYFEVDNPTPGVVESNVTLGSGGSITGGEQNDNYELYISGTATKVVNYIVFINPTSYTDNI